MSDRQPLVLEVLGALSPGGGGALAIDPRVVESLPKKIAALSGAALRRVIEQLVALADFIAHEKDSPLAAESILIAVVDALETAGRSADSDDTASVVEDRLHDHRGLLDADRAPRPTDRRTSGAEGRVKGGPLARSRLEPDTPKPTSTRRRAKKKKKAKKR
jgi:hypothetical protein